jgi:hypothetical protein
MKIRFQRKRKRMLNERNLRPDKLRKVLLLIALYSSAKIQCCSLPLQEPQTFRECSSGTFLQPNLQYRNI